MEQEATPVFDSQGKQISGAKDRSGTILVFGIISLVGAFCCNPIGLGFGIAAWVMGNNDMKAIQAGLIPKSAEGNTNAGKICGIIGTIISGLGLVVAVIYGLVLLLGIAAQGY